MVRDRTVVRDGQPSLSIVVPSIEGWPKIREPLTTILRSAERVDAEVIVVDGSGLPPPESSEVPGVDWIEVPGSSVFQARLVGYARAAGEVVAVTEDHCHVPLEWADRILDSHRRNPDASAIGGSVENGATSSMVDWASFFSLQTRYMSPIRCGPTDRINGHINVSYKRAALQEVEEFGGLGVNDRAHQNRLVKAGGSLVADDSITCAHVQSLGAVDTALGHFHAGRTFAGFRRRTMGYRGWARVGLLFVIPVARFVQVLAIGMTKRHQVALLTSSPLIFWFLMCQAAGQFVGYLAGPGDSPSQVI